MDMMDKAKLKCIIKMILIENSPKSFNSRQLCDIINKYKWGIHASITPTVVGRLLNYELNRGTKHYLDDLGFVKKGRGNVYYYAGAD